MNNLYVAGQDTETREWIPVAELREVSDGYELRYTRGAKRLPGFSGLSRMQDFEKVFFSKSLFPFFANRLIPKSRPEYRDFLRWLGREHLPISPIEILSLTGGARATDRYEVISPPQPVGNSLSLQFFARGLRYLEPPELARLMAQRDGDGVYLMKDVQNSKDPKAIAVRTESPARFIGYVPRYYCPGLTRLLDDPTARVRAKIKQVNPDAPLDLKLLLSVTAQIPEGYDLLSEVEDFLPLSTTAADRRVVAPAMRYELE